VARISHKCDPDEAQMLRDVFEAEIPCYHMNKRHWNTVISDGSIPQGEIERMIDCSYGLVMRNLKKPERQLLELKYGKEPLYC
jgi:predicted DNA-binding protein (MmcQ/YjbR family)